MTTPCPEVALPGSPPDHGKQPLPVIRGNTSSWFLGLLLTIALAWTLQATSAVSVPVAAAALIALAVWPICAWTQAHAPPRMRWLGVAAAMLVVVASLVLFAAVLAISAREVATGVEQHGPEAARRLSEGSLGAWLQQAERLAGGLEKVLGSVRAIAGSIADRLWQTIVGLSAIVFLVLLMLADGGTWSFKLASSWGDREGRGWSEVAVAVGQSFRFYVLITLLLGAATGALYAAWLALFGIPHLLVWASLAMALNFVPTVGAFISGGLPILFAFATRDLGTAAIIAAGILAIEIVMGNVVDPWVTGKRLSISPLAIVVALLVWSWIWGAAGALLAVPMTALLILVFAHLPTLAPLALMLSDERDMEGLRARARTS